MTRSNRGNPMRETRERLGWTREKLAAALDVSVWTIMRHEQRPALTRKGPWRLALKQIEVEGVVNGH